MICWNITMNSTVPFWSGGWEFPEVSLVGFARNAPSLWLFLIVSISSCPLVLPFLLGDPLHSTYLQTRGREIGKTQSSHSCHQTADRPCPSVTTTIYSKGQSCYFRAALVLPGFRPPAALPESTFPASVCPHSVVQPPSVIFIFWNLTLLVAQL